MADIKLFNINKTVKEYQSGTVTLEKELQTVCKNVEMILHGKSDFEKNSEKDIPPR